jgi:hypothetical protein
MKQRILLLTLVTTLFTTAALAQLGTFTSGSLAQDSRFFEMRTYHAAPGKLDALHARFRDHTNKIFADHGMQIVGFWVPMDKTGRYENSLIYILAFANKDARDKAWKDFAADPEWKKVRAESEKDGKLVENVDSQYMTATDYSPIK